jgi:hypothetical protein
MSDSAEQSASRHGSTANVTSPPSATLEPEAAERCASAFIPAWQFDSAPFEAREEQLSSSDLEELASGGIAKSEGPELPKPTPRAPPPVVAPLPLATSPLAFDDSEDVFRSRPRKGLLIGVAAGAAAILAVGIAWTRAATPLPSTPFAPTATLTRAAADVPVPPPPPLPSDVTVSTSIPPRAAPPPQEALSPAPSSPHRAVATQRTHAPESAHPSRNPLPPQKSPSKATAGLVRDNPF